MGLSTSQGIARNNVSLYDNGIDPKKAYQKSLDQMGRFNSFNLKNDQINRLANVTYGYSDDQLKKAMNLNQVTDAADKLKKYGDDLFAIFDKYKDNYKYLGENAGVSDTELTNRLGEARSGFMANADAQKQEYERDMRRMGVNPNSAKFAGFGTSNALQKAAGLSMTQNTVRKDARDESWKENMQVAELGLKAGNSGVGAVSNAANAYGQAGKLFSDQKIKYDSLNESARQYNKSYSLNQDALKLKAQNQAFAQAANRWQKGILQTNRYNGFGNLKSSTYDYGY